MNEIPREDLVTRIEREIELDDLENVSGDAAVPHFVRMIRRISKEIDSLRREVDELNSRSR